MWNNQSDTPAKPGRYGLIKRIVVFAVVVVAVCSAVGLFLFQESLNFDALRRWIKYFNIRDEGTEDLYLFDAHNSNRYGTAGSGLAVASVGGLVYYQDNGTERFSLQNQLSLPQLLTAGKMMLAYDAGGTVLLAADTNGERVRLTTEQPILDADLASNGSFCFASSLSGYKSVLTVYNSSATLAYRWLSSTTYMPTCAISEKGTLLAAIGLGASGGAFESSVYFFRTDSENILSTASLGNSLIYDLYFVDADTVCALGETAAYLVRSDGTLEGEFAYPEPYLKDYDTGGNGFLTLAVNMYRAGNRNSLVTMDDEGREIATLYLGEEILDLSAAGSYIAVLTADRLTIYTDNLEVYAETVDISAATSVLMREDGSVLLLGGGKGWLYLP